MSENCQKIKLLKLIELLRHSTDENNPLTTSKICSELIQMGITCDRRTLARDIKLLNEQGYEVMDTTVGREKAYYIDDRTFDVAEIKILIDAVQACSSITKKKSDQLIEKLAAMAGTHQGKIIKHNSISFNSRKHSNEEIFYNIDRLDEAIRNDRTVSFLYFDLDEQHNRSYRKNKKRYCVDPIALVYSEDNYYLVAYMPLYDNTVNYRLDRMEKVSIENDIITEAAKIERSVKRIAEYTRSVFHMYNGKSVEAVLRFSEKLLGPVYDKFGEDLRVLRMDENMLETKVRVSISPSFWGWLYEMGKDMYIVKPEFLRKRFIEYGREILDEAMKENGD